MQERIGKACGALPPPVLDKLLTLDATELDTLLTYPEGARRQVPIYIAKTQKYFPRLFCFPIHVIILLFQQVMDNKSPSLHVSLTKN